MNILITAIWLASVTVGGEVKESMEAETLPECNYYLGSMAAGGAIFGGWTADVLEFNSEGSLIIMSNPTSDHPAFLTCSEIGDVE